MTRTRVRTVGRVGVLVILTGCVSRLLVSDSGLTTDLATYDAKVTGRIYTSNIYAFPVIARFENRSSDTVYLARCSPSAPGPMYNVGYADGRSPADRFPAYSQAWGCVGHRSHIAVPPHRTRVDTLMLSGPNVFDGVTRAPRGNTEGRFRLEYLVRDCQEDSCDRDRVVSTAFIVRTSASPLTEGSGTRTTPP